MGTTSLSLGANSSLAVMDRYKALPDFSGGQLYSNAWIRVASVDYRVGSFNTGSGAFVGLSSLVNAIASGADFEVVEELSPADMDAMIDETILSLPVRREVGIPSVDGAHFYTLDGAASPHMIQAVVGVHYYANPASSLNRDRREFTQHSVVATATGIELRPGAVLGASLQIAIDAILQLTLGAGGDAATINYRDGIEPTEETILWGAAARCYDLMIARAPSQENALLVKRRTEAARMFSRLAQRFGPAVARTFTFATPFESSPSWPE